MPYVQHFLWNGIGAIEDLEDESAGPIEYDEALRLLRAKTSGDWTLWRRIDDKVQLLAISVNDGDVEFLAPFRVVSG